VEKNTSVYLDRQQCEEFEVEYFKSCTFNIPASTLLGSKRQGYDERHRDILEPLGGMILHLEHVNNEDWPGWFKIKNNDAEL